MTHRGPQSASGAQPRPLPPGTPARAHAEAAASCPPRAARAAAETIMARFDTKDARTAAAAIRRFTTWIPPGTAFDRAWRARLLNHPWEACRAQAGLLPDSLAWATTLTNAGTGTAAWRRVARMQPSRPQDLRPVTAARILQAAMRHGATNPDTLQGLVRPLARVIPSHTWWQAWWHIDASGFRDLRGPWPNSLWGNDGLRRAVEGVAPPWSLEPGELQTTIKAWLAAVHVTRARAPSSPAHADLKEALTRFPEPWRAALARRAEGMPWLDAPRYRGLEDPVWLDIVSIRWPRDAGFWPRALQQKLASAMASKSLPARDILRVLAATPASWWLIWPEDMAEALPRALRIAEFEGHMNNIPEADWSAVDNTLAQLTPRLRDPWVTSMGVKRLPRAAAMRQCAATGWGRTPFASP